MNSSLSDSLLADFRGRRQRLAASVRAAMLTLDRYPAGTFPAASQKQRAHEQQALEAALAALLASVPATEPTQVVDREIARSLRCLEAELELLK